MLLHVMVNEQLPGDQAALILAGTPAYSGRTLCACLLVIMDDNKMSGTRIQAFTQ